MKYCHSVPQNCAKYEETKDGGVLFRKLVENKKKKKSWSVAGLW